MLLLQNANISLQFLTLTGELSHPDHSDQHCHQHKACHSHSAQRQRIQHRTFYMLHSALLLRKLILFLPVLRQRRQLSGGAAVIIQLNVLDIRLTSHDVHS